MKKLWQSLLCLVLCIAVAIPCLPLRAFWHNKCIVDSNGDKVEVRTSNEHGLPHAHISGKGGNTTVGLDKKPMRGHPPFSKQQRKVIDSFWEEIVDGILSFFLMEDNLEILIQRICENRWYAFKCYREIKKNPDLLGKMVQNSVNQDVLLGFIDKSVAKETLRYILVAVIDVLNASDISDSAFSKLIDYPDVPTREFLIVSLCHKSLTEAQLIRLCEEETQFECFFELAILYYKNHGMEDFVFFMKQFKDGKFGYMYPELLEELSSLEHSDFQKSEWIKREKTL